jgi:hypothetical protein
MGNQVFSVIRIFQIAKDMTNLHDLNTYQGN